MAFCRFHAKFRGISHDYSAQQAWAQFKKQNGQCAITGLELKFSRPKRRTIENNTVSLDRIDSGVGYQEGNVQWVHKDINVFRNHFSMDRFLDMCRKIAARKDEIDRTLQAKSVLMTALTEQT